MRIALLLTILFLTGCASAGLRSDDPRRAVVLAPYHRVVAPFGQITLAEGTLLYPGVVDGQPAWCTANAAFFSPGEARAVCLFDPAGGQQEEGWLKSAYVANTLASLRYEVDIPYRVGQRASMPPRR